MLICFVCVESPRFFNTDYARSTRCGRCFGREFDSPRLHAQKGIPQGVLFLCIFRNGVELLPQARAFKKNNPWIVFSASGAMSGTVPFGTVDEQAGAQQRDSPRLH